MFFRASTKSSPLARAFTRRLGQISKTSDKATPSERTVEKRRLILDILNSTATKREARYYLNKYPLLDENNIYKHTPQEVIKNQAQYDTFLGDLLDTGTIAQPQQDSEDAGNEIHLSDTIRVILIRIRGFDELSEDTISGIASTIGKCMKLGASPVIVLDDIEHNSELAKSKADLIKLTNERCNKLIDQLQADGEFQMRPIPDLFQIDPKTGNAKFSIQELITVPLFQGTVPVLTPWVVNQDKLYEQESNSFDILKYSVQNFVKLNRKFKARCNNDNDDFVTVEKIVFIDKYGGIPSLERFQSSHVFINLLQEYDALIPELQHCRLKPDERAAHEHNLEEMNELLTIAPNATGIITTPQIATLKRLHKMVNPIIHNILTDRPMISSSLPVNIKKTPLLNTTIIKKGTPIDIQLSDTGLDLVKLDQEGAVDLKKLKHLIDDSFGRDIDMDHYLNRINGRVAGLIIAGDYDAGAILTWETPPTDPSRRIAYLDKFAVLKKLQGLPGLADIVFKAMLLSYKDELVWRSRMNNPVNKWYFERSVGNCHVPETQWRMFYCGKKVPSEQDLRNYSSVCKSIVPSFKH